MGFRGTRVGRERSLNSLVESQKSILLKHANYQRYWLLSLVTRTLKGSMILITLFAVHHFQFKISLKITINYLILSIFIWKLRILFSLFIKKLYFFFKHYIIESTWSKTEKKIIIIFLKNTFFSKVFENKI